MHLALEVGVSPRHLSFVETGRSKPSPELVESIAEELEIPLRERNTLLLAAGYAPRYRERALEDPAMRFAVESVQRMLDAHDPYPGVLIDRQWNIVRANAAASALTAGLPDALLGPPLNVYRVCLHPDGLAGRTANFSEWAAHLVGQLERSLGLTGDPALQAFARRGPRLPERGDRARGRAAAVRRRRAARAAPAAGRRRRAQPVHDPHDVRNAS